MRIEPSDDGPCARAAARIAAAAEAAIAARGRFTLALSGGRTPTAMLRALAREPVRWEAVELFQVDERVVPAGHPDRNLTPLGDALLAPLGDAGPRLHAMPVDDADLDAAARRYARELESAAGTPPVLDLVQLGLGADGHTASLVPGDPALDATAPVALTGAYQGRRRMTLTLPVLNGARALLWLVTGADKADAVARLLRADATIPAGRVAQARAELFADGAALAEVA